MFIEKNNLCNISSSDPLTKEIIQREISIGDIHGHFKALKLLWDKIKFNPNSDKIIFLGDYIDRGSKSKEVYLFIKELKEKYPDNIILICGNHEDMLLYDYKLWVYNGGRDTELSFNDELLIHEFKKFILNNMVISYESENAIYVHGGIPNDKTLYTTCKHDLMWCRDEYGNENKVVIVGHDTVNDIIITDKYIKLDTGAVYTGKLSAYDIISKKEYVVKTTNDYYISPKIYM